MEKGVVTSPGRPAYTLEGDYPPTSPSSGLKRFLGSKGSAGVPVSGDINGTVTSPAAAYSTAVADIDDYASMTANPARAGTDG